MESGEKPRYRSPALDAIWSTASRPIVAWRADGGHGPMQGRIDDVSVARPRPLYEAAGVEGAPARRHYRRISRTTALTDILSVATAMLVAHWLVPGDAASSRGSSAA